MARLTEDDQGKPVFMGDEKVGMIQRIEDNTAYVDPDAGVTDQVKATLDWRDADEDGYPLPEDRVDTITADEVRLRTQM